MESKFIPTIGLEIHAELHTKSKLFCGCANDPQEKEPNVNICPICMAHPGTLPMVNKEAIKKIIQVGIAIGGSISKYSIFDRKHYFYPDIPKGYQISQYENPFVKGGELSSVSITRVHLEEDTAKSNHEQLVGSTLIDFNRAGVPLMELVTEPVIKGSDEAVTFAKELQLLLKSLGVSKARMERGEMRVEANISVSDNDTLGSKVEIKNLNSFKSLGLGIAFEIERQRKIKESGENVVSETRGWDENREITFSQRHKETSQEYRYFKEPDLPPVYVYDDSSLNPDVVKSEMPMTHLERRAMLESKGIKKDDIEVIIDNRIYSSLMDEVLEVSQDEDVIKKASNYIISYISTLGDMDNKAFNGKDLVSIILSFKKGVLTSTGVKDTIKDVYTSSHSVEDAISMYSKEDDTSLIEEVVKGVIEENEDAVNFYKNGKESSIQFLIGQGMKKTSGRADPNQLMIEIKRQIGR